MSEQIVESGVAPALDWAQLRGSRVLAETADYLVLDKPVGLSVTGERHDTDLVRIAADTGELLIPVHRIDKVTSGAVLLARSTAAHGWLTRQFAKRTVRKSYLVITRSVGLPAFTTVDLPLAVGRKNRVRIAAARAEIRYDQYDAYTGRWSVPEAAVRPGGLASVTVLRRLWQGTRHTLVAAEPHTGRRHQIRVHLAWIGHPIVGDPLFPAADGSVRTCLHAWRLAFDDSVGNRVLVEAVPDEPFWTPVAAELPATAAAELLAHAVSSV